MTVPLIDTSKPAVALQPVGGPKGKLNSVDLKKIGIGLGVALIGATVTYAGQVVGDIDLGPTWTPFVVALATALVNSLRKLLDAPRSTL